jgi:isoquinoline 1-oxidoreductase alpha subunit
MTAASLLAKNANPTDADIDNAMDANLCRCGTYVRIRKAVHRAAELMRTQTTSAPRTTASNNSAPVQSR